MTRKDALMRLTARLLARRAALRKTLSGDIDAFHEVSHAYGVGDDVDAAIDSENDEIFSQLVEFETRELAQIEHALERIADGKCGRCEYCGGRIPAARMAALPYTTSCIDCQRAYERAGLFGALDQNSKSWAKVRDPSIDDDVDEFVTHVCLSDLGMAAREPTHRFSARVLVS
jgi:DnaK suppressor protein